MIIIDTKLKERELRNQPIQCGVLGAGEMTLGLVNQIERHVPGMRVSVMYNRTRSKAERCYEAAGFDVDDICQAKTPEEVDQAIDDASPCIVETPDFVWLSTKVDVVVEMTGTINEAFGWIVSAMKHGKKVVSFNAELDSTLGPSLQKIATHYNTRYTLGDGDQPGVTQNLWRQVKMMGFTPLVCGNIKGFLNNHRTPDDQRVFAEQYGLSLNMVTSFTDGTKIAFEQASTANATGMQVAQRGMIGIHHKGHIDELLDRYDIEDLKKRGGIVEMVVGATPGPGVFVFAISEDPINQRFLKYVKMGAGPLYSFYVPYHLLFFELPFSIARLMDFEDGTVDSFKHFTVEVITIAKRDLKAGETLDGIGGYCYYGLCENTPTVRKEGLMPAGLAEGKVLLRDIPKDSPIAWSDVSFECLPTDTAYFNLLKEEEGGVGEVLMRKLSETASWEADAEALWGEEKKTIL